MDLPAESEVIKKCFKCEHVLYDSLNIVYNETTSMLVLWNKFQIFVYEDRNLDNAAKIFVPEFQIYELILSNNYILCLDSNCNVHTISLKFKNPAQKRLKSSFLPREQSITACFHVQDHALSIQFDAQCIYLCLHRINTEFLLEKKVELKYASPWPLPRPTLSKCVLTSYKINEQHFEQINKLYNSTNMPKNCNIVVMSFDRITVFSCLFSSKMSEDEIALIKLHTCPSEINKMEIMDDLTLLVCLTTGTIIQFYLKDISKDPNIIHFNIAIHKYLVLNETLVYTDGLSMWRSDKTFSEDVTFQQFIMKHVKDLMKCGDQLICTTYSNLIYNISLDDEAIYLKTNEYCTAEKLLNNAEYLYKILEEVDRNNDMVKKVREEGNYITVLSLSNRQDIMDTIIQHEITVYETYKDVILDHTELLLTDNMSEYFNTDTVLFVVKISMKMLQQTFNNILANLFNDLQIHLSFVSNNKLLKTTSLKLRESFKKIGILTSLNVKLNINLSKVDVIVKLISSIPGCHDMKQPLWSCLYQKQVPLKSEHFIKTNTSTASNTNLKESKDSIENLVCKLENNYHRQTFKFVDVSKYISSTDWSVYLKLPSNYVDLFKNCSITELSKNKANYLVNQFRTMEFLEAKSDILLEIGTEKAKVTIINDFAPLLKVSSENISVAHNIRIFFSRLVYKDFKEESQRANREYVKYTLYNVTENLQKELKSCLVQRPTLDIFKSIAEHFERSVIGSLPI